MPPDLHGPPLSYALARLTRQIRRGMADVRIEELSGPQLVALMTLQQEPGLSNAQMARRCYVSPQAMSEVVLDLEGRKLLSRAPDPANQRILRAKVTAVGAKLIRQTQKRIQELEEQMLDGFDEREVREFRRAVARAARNLGVPSADPGPDTT